MLQMLMALSAAQASTPVEMTWTEQSVDDPSVRYEVTLYGLGSDSDGDGLVDRLSLAYEVTTLQGDQPVFAESGTLAVRDEVQVFGDAAIGRTVVLDDGTIALGHRTEQVTVSSGQLWLFGD